MHFAGKYKPSDLAWFSEHAERDGYDIDFLRRVYEEYAATLSALRDDAMMPASACRLTEGMSENISKFLQENPACVTPAFLPPTPKAASGTIQRGQRPMLPPAPKSCLKIKRLRTSGPLPDDQFIRPGSVKDSDSNTYFYQLQFGNWEWGYVVSQVSQAKT